MKSFSLADIQKQFQQCLLDDSQQVPDWVENQHALNATKRLAIYREAYRLRLIDALASDFPTCKAIMGDAVFIKWCDAYIKKHPSPYYSLRYFGQNFSSFLETNNESLVAELAQFEWLLSCAFDAPDDESVTRDMLAAIPVEAWATLQLQLHPSVYLCEMKSNVPAVWQEFNKTSAVGSLVSAEKSPWVIWRHNLTIYFRSLSLTEFALLRVLKESTDWQSLCDACDQFPTENSAQEMAGLLNVWVNDGLVCLGSH